MISPSANSSSSMAVRSWQVTFVFQNVVFSRSYCHLLQLHILNCPPPVAVSFCTANACSEVPFNRYASLTARGALPSQSEWYYSHDQSRGLGAIVNIMFLAPTDSVNITIEYGPDAMDASALNGVRSRRPLLCPFPLLFFVAGAWSYPARCARQSKYGYGQVRFDFSCDCFDVDAHEMPVMMRIRETPITFCLIQVYTRLHFPWSSLHLCFGGHRPSP